MELKWHKCSEIPSESMPCLIAYADGTIVCGSYCHQDDFYNGGYFTSLYEFDSQREQQCDPEYWMPMPALPSKEAA